MQRLITILSLLVLAQPGLPQALRPSDQVTPVRTGWTAFGDSYAAGIGAGARYKGPAGGNSGDDCYRRTGAYPVKLHNTIHVAGGVSDGWRVEGSVENSLLFLACSGDKTKHVLGRQMDEFRAASVEFKDVATLSIGGNDLGFAKVLDSCVYRARVGIPPCETRLEKAEEGLKTIGVTLGNIYRDILKAADEGGAAVTFRLFVTGYPRFFRDDTLLCNKSHWSFFKGAEPNKQMLLTTLRRQMNDLVVSLNREIERAVTEVNNAAPFGSVRFIDIDPPFGEPPGHRFCEDGVKEPLDRPETWYFHMKGKDVAPEGNPVEDSPDPHLGPPDNFTLAECQARLEAGTPDSVGPELGRYFGCAIRQGLVDGEELEDWLDEALSGGLQGDFLMGYWEPLMKTFHPKSVGLDAVKRRVLDSVRRDPILSAQPVLIMHQGTQAGFDDMVAGVRPVEISRGRSRRYRYDGIDTRGYFAFVPVQYARSLRERNMGNTGPGIVGVSFENLILGAPDFPAPPGQAASGEDSLPGLRGAGIEHGDQAASLLSRRQTTQTDLDLQTDAGWHLRVLSDPPTGYAREQKWYYRYPGYLHDPLGGGEQVFIYVLDLGVDERHPDLQGRMHRGRFTASGVRDTLHDRNGHGTAMASVIGGRRSGVTKNGYANIIDVKYQRGGDKSGSKYEVLRASDLFECLLWILNHVRQNGKQGKAILNFSSGIPYRAFAGNEWEPTFDEASWTDPWHVMLPLFAQNDVVVVAAAGNTGTGNLVVDDFDYESGSPRRFARPGRPGEHTLIVVGGSSEDRSIWGHTTWIPDIITVFAPADKMMVAEANTQGFKMSEGTSEATAITSALISTFLLRHDLSPALQNPGRVAAAVKRLVTSVAKYHTGARVFETGVQPYVANQMGTYNYIPCVPDGQLKNGRGGSRALVAPRANLNVVEIRRPGRISTANAVCDEGLLDKPAVLGLYYYVGCFFSAPGAGGRQVLDGLATTAAKLEHCLFACAAFPLFGMARGTQCYCGNRPNGPIMLDEKVCSIPCHTDRPASPDYCGGQEAISIYSLTGVLSRAAQVGQAKLHGCFSDKDAISLLNEYSIRTDLMTPTYCTEACHFQSPKSTHWGIKNGNDCYCGTISAAALERRRTSAWRCNKLCVADQDFFCGGVADTNVWEGYGIGPAPPDDLGGPASPCLPSPLACSDSLCNGTFANSKGACQSALLPGCPCTPSPSTPGYCIPSRGCDDDGCAGSFDAAGKTATCTSAFAGCSCKPNPKTCTTADRKPRSCGDAGCRPEFDGQGVARCTGSFAGCECAPTDSLCGAATGCNAGGCAGNFTAADKNTAKCQGRRKGCPCIPGEEQCGKKPASCDTGGCAGDFSLEKTQARCTQVRSYCPCVPDKACGKTQQSCDIRGCEGDFSASKTQAHCTANYKDCPCTPDKACGPQAKCEIGGCAGDFSLDKRQAHCTGNFKDCPCKPGKDACGNSLSCERGDCGGSFKLDKKQAHCEGNYKDCPCNPGHHACGDPLSCEKGECRGSFKLDKKQAHCDNNYKDCPCFPGDDACGKPKVCERGGCNGTWVAPLLNTYCATNYKDCVCLGTADTPGYCRRVYDCADKDCKGKVPSHGDPELWSHCTVGRPRCPCQYKPPPAPPAPPPKPDQPLPLADDWFCLATWERTLCDRLHPNQECLRAGGLASVPYPVREDKGGYPIFDVVGSDFDTVPNPHGLCGARFGQAVVVCHGDITQQCSEYRVAEFSGRSCRTYCPRYDPRPTCLVIWDAENPPGVPDQYMQMVLVCDRYRQ